MQAIAVLAFALIAANLPFVNERLLAVVPLWLEGKPLPVRLAELVVLYLLSGAVGALFEHRQGQITPQGWEFYVVTGALFVVLAFPGFTWRYLLKHRKHHA
ncbi:MAG: DUF2818 family protein [Janthinobacterium lividum]